MSVVNPSAQGSFNLGGNSASTEQPAQTAPSARGYTDPNTRGDTTAPVSAPAGFGSSFPGQGQSSTPSLASTPGGGPGYGAYNSTAPGGSAPMGGPGYIPPTGANSTSAPASGAAAPNYQIGPNGQIIDRNTGLPPGVPGVQIGQGPRSQAPNPTPGGTSGSSSYWGGTNPWAQSVTATNEAGTQNWATPGNPNNNYVTPDAAQKLAATFGANAVSQNLNGMASPNSGAPSAPMYGLDFGYGDVQDAGMGAFQLQRGDPEWLVRQRYQAGLNNTGWGGPAPSATASNNMFWNRATPESRNPVQASMAPTGKPSFGFDTFLKNQSNDPSASGAYTGAPPQASGNPGSLQGGNAGLQQFIALLSQLFGPQQASAMLAQYGGVPQDRGQTTRQAPLTQARNTSLQRNYFYPNTEPRLY